jgi:sugar lactone lactonase YvrE
MTQIKVDTIVDAAGTAAADFTSGLTVAGAALSTLNTAEYYETGTEPTSPKNGAIWKDTANDKVMVYIAGEFKEIELGAAAGAASWTVDLSNVTYDNKSFSTATQDANSNTTAFSSDGTKMYSVGNISDAAYQYSMSTAWDVSTASYDNVSYSLVGRHTLPFELRFNSDGTKMYSLGYGTDTIHQHSLTTGFDLSTASYDSVSFNVYSLDSAPNGLTFNADGTKMYFVGNGNDSVYQCSLTTAYDVSTASYDNVSLSASSQDTLINGVAFNTDGTKMYLSGGADDSLYQYSLTTGFDLSTASYDSVDFDLSSQTTKPNSLVFSYDGTKVYVSKYGTVYQYSTGL